MLEGFLSSQWWLTTIKRWSRRTLVGIGLTVLWLATWALIALLQSSDAPPSAWVEFLAGVFVPIAFLWLVLGYLRQSEELARTTAALRAQEEQLRVQVQQANALLREYARQVEISAKLAQLQSATPKHTEDERLAAIRPKFRVRNTTHHGARETRLRVENAGGYAYHLELDPIDMVYGGIVPHEEIDSGSTFDISLTHRQVVPAESLRFAIRCSDRTGAEHVFNFVLKGNAVHATDAEYLIPPPQS
jgi:hypothetical protein